MNAAAEVTLGLPFLVVFDVFFASVLGDTLQVFAIFLDRRRQEIPQIKRNF